MVKRPEYLRWIMSQSAYEKAEKHGLQVVLPTNHQLFIDIDGEEAYAVFVKNYPQFCHWYEVTEKVETPSKSGLPKKHIYITLKEKVTDNERLVLQAFLGSDLVREFLGMMRINANDSHVTLFLEKK